MEAHWPQLQHNTTLDGDRSRDTMSLRIVQPSNVTRPQVTSHDLVHRHAAIV
jgi:hypothetical protein